MATPFSEDMAKLANGNDYFQKEVYLDKRVQIVLMSIPAGEDIGEETHGADQTTFFVSGEGTAIVDGHKTKAAANRMLVIPQGAKHNIVNNGKAPLKLFSVYAPPAEPEGVAHRTKEDAEAAEEGFISRAAKTLKAAVGAA